MLGRTTFLLPAAALVACAALVLACSGGGGGSDAPAGPRTLDGYVAELSGLLDDANEAVVRVYIELFRDSGDDPSVGDQVEAAYDVSESYRSLLADLGEGLNELQPPEEVADAHRALVATIDPAVDSWEAFSEQVDQVETQDELYEAYDPVHEHLRAFEDPCDEIRDIAAEQGVPFEASCSINFE